MSTLTKAAQKRARRNALLDAMDSEWRSAADLADRAQHDGLMRRNAGIIAQALVDHPDVGVKQPPRRRSSSGYVYGDAPAKLYRWVGPPRQVGLVRSVEAALDAVTEIHKALLGADQPERAAMRHALDASMSLEALRGELLDETPDDKEQAA